VVIVAEDVAKQQPGKPLTAKGLVHLDMQNADGVLVPASAERVHLPNERTPSRPLAHLLLQPKALDLQGTAHALLIPARRAAAPRRGSCFTSKRRRSAGKRPSITLNGRSR